MQDHPTARPGVALEAFEQVMFAGLDAPGMNACVVCCDRWAEGNRVALEWFDRDHNQIDQTYLALQADAARFANLLTVRGVRPGEVVAGLLPRGAELLTVVLGTWRAGAVYQPIFAGLDAAAIESKISGAGGVTAKLVVTDSTNRAKLDQMLYCPPVLVVTGGAPVPPGDGDFRAELARQSAWFAAVPRRGEDPFVLLFTTDAGRLQPVTLPLLSLVAAASSLQIGIDPREADIGWDVADPGWSFGLYFAVMRPLLLGLAAVAYESDSLASQVSPIPGAPLQVSCEKASPSRRLHHAPALLCAA